MPKGDLPPVMTVQQVMDYLQVSKKWVYRAVQTKQLTGTKFGNTWRFRREDVEGLLVSR